MARYRGPISDIPPCLDQDAGQVDTSGGWDIDLQSLGKPDQSVANDAFFRQKAYQSYRTIQARQASPIDSIRERVFRSIRYVQHELPTDVLRTRKDYQSISELATR